MAGRAIRRIGLIGLGKHGMRYVRHIRADFPDLVLAAAARRDAAKAAAAERELGVRVYTEYSELIERGGLDAVIAVAPPTLNADIVARAARAGVPALIEKPAAPNLAAGRAMLAALAANPVPLMVAQTLRYNAVVRGLMAERESIAPLRSFGFSQRFEPSPLDWLDDPARSGGGIVLHTGVHSFDLLLALSGQSADTVTCQMSSILTRRTEDAFAATVSLDGGAALATVSCARACGGRNGYIELAGERGTLIGDHVVNRAYRIVGTTVEPLPLGPPVSTVREVLGAFVAALRSGAPMPISLADGLRAVALVDACYAAARSGRTAAVEPVGAG